MSSQGFTEHDHAACIAEGMAAADKACAERGLRMTPVRRRVLEYLLREHRALGAYEILDKLSAEGFGKQPPVAYRALDFLVTHGFAHRIEKLNAFIACALPGKTHQPVFLICSDCGAVAETDTAPATNALGRAAKASGFAIEHTMIEAEGKCTQCAGTAGSA